MNSTPQWHYRVDLRPICVPLEHCNCARYGLVNTLILDQLKQNDYEQAPILDSDINAVGIADTKALENLHSQNLPLTEASPVIDNTMLESETTLDALLETLSSKRAVLIVDAHRPIGLLTISDLNKHHIRSVIYPLLAKLEIELAALISETCTDPWDWIPNLPRQRQVQVIGYWEVTKRAGVETGALTGCTLTDLIEVLAKNEVVRSKVGYQDASQVRLALGNLRQFRNKVMHPVSPLVLSMKEVGDMRETIKQIEKLGGLLENNLSASHKGVD